MHKYTQKHNLEIKVFIKASCQMVHTSHFLTGYMQGKLILHYMSRAMRKPDFCLCENKGADQLRSNCEADQRLCFRYTDSTIPLLLKYDISNVYPSSEATQTSLCQTCSETPKTGFLALSATPVIMGLI